MKLSLGRIVGTCSICSQEGACITMTATHGSAVSDREVVCLPCIGGDSLDVLMVLEEPQYNKGRSPPSRKRNKMTKQLESKVARDIGGKTQPGSGNIPGLKGDIRRRGKDRGEEKSTIHQSYSLERAILNKIRSEALFPEKPALIIHFLDPTAARIEDAWAVIPYDDWTEYRANADKDR